MGKETTGRDGARGGRASRKDDIWTRPGRDLHGIDGVSGAPAGLRVDSELGVGRPGALGADGGVLVGELAWFGFGLGFGWG